MNIKISKQIGKSTMEIEVDDKDDKEAIAKATFFMQPDYCGLCKKSNVVWNSNKAKTEDGTFTYVKRVCLDCRATSTMGSYKDGGFFWKNWEIYQDKNGSHEPVVDY